MTTSTVASRKILITSHCVLNQNAVVQPLARSSGVMKSAVDWARDEGYGIFQLPCPEFRLLGPTRPPMSFDEYNTQDFHESNKKLLGPVIAQLKAYQDNGYEIVGGLHVQDSPSCDPATGNWVSDLLAAAEEAGIVIREIWQIPSSDTGSFDPDDPSSYYGDPSQRPTPPPVPVRDSAVFCGPTIPVRDPSND